MTKPKNVNDLQALIKEAAELRFGAALPTSAQGPSEVIRVLGDIRTRLDRVEAILVDVTRFRATADRTYATHAAEHEDKWNTEVQEINRRGYLGEGGPRERYAVASLKSMDQKRLERQAARLVSHAVEAVDVVRTLHRGLDSLRLDTHRILQGMTIETRYER